MCTPNKPLQMYNLNVNLTTTMAGGGIFDCNTPRTPEILNSLIAMTNPFDAIGKAGQENASPSSETGRSLAASPHGSQTMSPPSVQHTCSQLIKEGLKLTLQSKRKFSGSESKDDDDDDDELKIKRAKNEELTAEDEERRKRRRERNKIAATKCRMKKREKTANLITESEVLESQNLELKEKIKQLDRQRRGLEQMLSTHLCVKRQTNYEPYPVPYDPDFGEDTALISYNKDPNFGKLMESLFPGENRGKVEGEFHEPDEDIYRPNGAVDSAFFVHNDSGYSSFSSNALEPGCRA